jgi:hypothetical protein
VNEGTKYPITGGDRGAIQCHSRYCAVFGTFGQCDLVIYSGSNSNNESYCHSNEPSFWLPAAEGVGCVKDSSSINGGKEFFKSKELEVYRVFVRFIIKNII